MKSFIKTLARHTNALTNCFALLTSLMSVSAGAQEVYLSSQMESDLHLNSAYYYNSDSDEYLYSQPEYITGSDLSSVKNQEDLFDRLKIAGTRYLPKPKMIPIGVDGLPIFIPLYEIGKQLGNDYVQRIFVLEQIYQQLGVRVIDKATYGSEAEQFNTLYISAERFAKKHGLVFGQAMPVDLWDQIVDGDMIWPEVRNIDGEDVLVPVVYLTDQTVANFKVTSHKWVAEGEFVYVGGVNIGPSSVMDIRTDFFQVVDKLSIQSGGRLNVSGNTQQAIIGGALDIYGGRISAEQNLNITAQSITLRPTISIDRNQYGERQVIGSAARVDAANGKIVLNAQQDIIALAANIQGKEVTLDAGGNIKVAGVQLQETLNYSIQGGYHNRTTVSYVGSKISGEDAVRLIAGGYIDITASDLISDQGVIEILAGQGIYVENEFGIVQEQMHSKIGKTTTDMSHFRTVAIKANLKAGKGIHMNTDVGPIVLRATDIESQDGTSLNAANGQVHLLMTKEQDQYSYNKLSEGLLTIKTEMETWDRDSAVYNTIVGGLEVNALQGMSVEYGGKAGEDTMGQIENLSKLPGMEWMADAQAMNCEVVHAGAWSNDLSPEEKQALIAQEVCADFGFVELMDMYEYDKSTMLSPAAMAIIAIAVSVATGGAGSGPMAAMMSAAQTTLMTQAIQVAANTALNGGSPYDAWKALGSKDNIRQLATSIVTAGVLSYANQAMGFTEAAAGTKDYGFFSAGQDSLSFADQAIQVVTETTISSTIDVLAQGGSLSDFGSDFEDQFKVMLVSNAANAIGQSMANGITNSVSEGAWGVALEYVGHAAVGCLVGVASNNGAENQDQNSDCSDGAFGAVSAHLVSDVYEAAHKEEVLDLLAEEQAYFANQLQGGATEGQLRLIAGSDRNTARRNIDRIRASGADLTKMSAALGALIAGADINIAAGAGSIAASASLEKMGIREVAVTLKDAIDQAILRDRISIPVIDASALIGPSNVEIPDQQKLIAELLNLRLKQAENGVWYLEEGNGVLRAIESVEQLNQLIELEMEGYRKLADLAAKISDAEKETEEFWKGIGETKYEGLVNALNREAEVWVADQEGTNPTPVQSPDQLAQSVEEGAYHFANAVSAGAVGLFIELLAPDFDQSQLVITDKVINDVMQLAETELGVSREQIEDMMTAYDVASAAYGVKGLVQGGGTVATYVVDSINRIKKNEDFDDLRFENLNIEAPAVPSSSTPGNVILGAKDELDRPTGVTAVITKDMLWTGSGPNQQILPPGFEGGANNHSRGHLLANILGGDGNDDRNLVTLFQQNANSPYMRGFEREVKNRVLDGEVVSYRAIPIYDGNDLVPSGVTLSARGSNGFAMDVSIQNINVLDYDIDKNSFLKYDPL